MASFTLHIVRLMALMMQTHATSFLQTGKYTSVTKSMRSMFPFSLSESQESCAELQNKGTYFSVAVTVGTPEEGVEPQTFELVADTGSSAVIVTSCICVEKGFGCEPHDKCFIGTNRSSTFHVPETLDHGEHVPTIISMTFGSGTVNSIIASDYVTVADTRVMMEDGLLLMVDRRELQVPGPFEGILGLGIESKPSDSTGDLMPTHPKAPDTKLFLKEAGVERFSLCFNDNGEAGALRLNLPHLPDALPAVGTFHWGLGLTGVAIGDDENEVLSLCDPSDLKPGQSTPCAMIPDSGTTLMMGPKDQIEKIFSRLCDKWDRCNTARTSGDLQMSKSHAFQALLYDCNSWLYDENGDPTGDINEVPSISLTVGENGTSKILTLTAWAYITETMEEEYHKTVKHVMGNLIPFVEPTGKQHKVCVPSFGVQDYNTEVNGPVWIMGTPIFYQYTVGYDLSGPSISFAEGACSTCGQTSANFLSKRSELVSGNHRSRSLRKLSGTPRKPDIDMSLPL